MPYSVEDQLTRDNVFSLRPGDVVHSRRVWTQYVDQHDRLAPLRGVVLRAPRIVSGKNGERIYLRVESVVGRFDITSRDFYDWFTTARAARLYASAMYL